MVNSSIFSKNWFRILTIWGISFGGIVGWSSFVMPGTMFLPISGTLGTTLALLIGGITFTMIAANFHNMMNRKGNTGNTGGVFAYTKEIFGYDYSLICVWSMLIAYVAIMCTNSSAFTLIARYLLGPVFQWGFHYTIAGYDVWLGEIVVTVLIIVSNGLLCAKFHKTVRFLQALLAVVLFIGVTFCFIIAFIKTGASFSLFKPAFAISPDGAVHPVSQVMNIMAISPWLFIGFCVVSLLPGKSEFSDGSFPLKKSFAIMAAAVFCGMLTYIFLVLMATLSLPEGCDTWRDYIKTLSDYTDLTSIPTFYAVQNLLGKPGLITISICAVAAMLTGILSMYRAAARLLQSMAEDDVLPQWFAKTNENKLPQNATVFIMLVSIVIPFFGRTASSWIVDVATITASISYASVSAASFVVAKKEKNWLFMATGIGGIIISIFCCFPIIPNPLNPLSLSKPAYLILAGWGLFGLIMFRYVFIRDKKNRFGTSTIMWVIMIFIVLISSMMWQRQVTYDDTEEMVKSISLFHQQSHIDQNIPMTIVQVEREKNYMEELMEVMRNSQFGNSILQVLMIFTSLAIMLNIFTTQKEREKQSFSEKLVAEKANKAKSMFLSSMSHDIRTPMNAILGMNEMILRETKEEKTLDYAYNIKVSGKILLSLINSLLDFSKIEEGKMEIFPIPYETAFFVNNIINSISKAAEEKGLEFVVNIDENLPCVLLGDDIRINQVIMNLLSNAVKYTQRGRVTFTMRTEKIQDESIELYVEVSDTGIGIRKEDMERLFTPFERLDEQKNRSIQGTGLGISIVTRLLNLMGSKVELDSIYGIGSSFHFTLKQEIVDPAPMGDYKEPLKDKVANSQTEITLYAPKAKILVADDNETNLKVAKNFLKLIGIVPDMVSTGFDVIKKMKEKQYHIVLLDHMMPRMSGSETLKKLREEKLIGDTIIIAFTANVVAGAKEEYLKEGFDGMLSKPLELERLQDILKRFLPKDVISSKKPALNDSDVLEFSPQGSPQEEDPSQSKAPSDANLSGMNGWDFFNMKNALNKSGIDTEQGLHFCANDKDFYIEMLSGFVSSKDEKLKELDSYAKEKDFKNYRILVHALKSNTKSLGANELSKKAKELEDASKEENEIFINENHKKFIEFYEKTAKIIQQAL